MNSQNTTAIAPVITIEKNGVQIRIHADSGYVEHRCLEVAVECHEHMLSLPDLNDILPNIRPFLGTSPPSASGSDGSLFLHPQVAARLLAGRTKLIQALYLALATRAQTPVSNLASRVPDEPAVKVAEERTKQVKLQTDTVQQAIASLSNYNVASRPHVVDLLSSMITSLKCGADVSVSTGVSRS